MEILDSEKRRARNLIWNAAADYSFEPDFKAYDEDGRADLYWNSIIGAVRKNYGAETIEGLFESLHGCSKEQLFEQLLWLGLENAVYQREAPRRPALPSLRRSYARRAVALDQRADPGDLLATLENAHFCRALGQSEPPLLPRDREMLDALEFPGDLDGPAIAEPWHSSTPISISPPARPRPRSRRSGNGAAPSSPSAAGPRRTCCPPCGPLATGSGSIW
ncbi:MAG: hypothetical protein ACLSUM_09085 [Dysosmobacter welbionis]